MGVLGYQPIKTKISLLPKLIGRRLAKPTTFATNRSPRIIRTVRLMVLAKDLKSENMGEFYRLEKEENGLFKRENKGECWVGEGRERSIQKREKGIVLGRRRKRKEYSKERKRDSAR
jgi:hypothetical protein